MSYKLYEHEKVEKFLYKHKNDKKLLLRINKKIMEILKNPHNPDFKELKSNKCPILHRHLLLQYYHRMAALCISKLKCPHLHHRTFGIRIQVQSIH